MTSGRNLLTSDCHKTQLTKKLVANFVDVNALPRQTDQQINQSVHLDPLELVPPFPNLSPNNCSLFTT